MGEWAEAGDYDLACKCMTIAAYQGEPPNDVPVEDFRHAMRTIHKALFDAHVLTIKPEQVMALPQDTTEQEVIERMKSNVLPFNPLYVSIPNGVFIYRGENYDGNQYSHWVGTLLAINEDEHLGVVPFVKQRDVFQDGTRGLPMTGGMVTVPLQYFSVTDDGLLRLSQTIYDLIEEGEREESVYDAQSMLRQTMEILYFLESANVYIGEQEVSRQVRRQAQRKGKRIADEVLVRQGKRSKPRRSDNPEARDYSHRFEVRGHYKHFGEDTQLANADPTKLVDVPGRGLCRRIWCPPFVKGDPSKPLIPKVRRVVSK